MSTEKTEGILTDESEKIGSEKHGTIIKVPISCVITVPVEIDFDLDKLEKTASEEFGCFVANPLENREAAEMAVNAANNSTAACKAFDGLTSAAMRFKDVFPEVEIYVTPFAGLVKEQKL